MGTADGEACMDAASFLTTCLYCQPPYGCNPYINHCRFQGLPPPPPTDGGGEEVIDDEAWMECDAETVDMLEHCTAQQLETLEPYRDGEDGDDP